MLLDLPAEVFLEISRYLNFKNKLILTSTCRKLHYLISNATLYENLDTKSRHVDAEAVIKRFQSKEFNGYQVKSLETRMQDLPGELMLQLPEIFPNVTKVRSYYNEDIEYQKRVEYFREYTDEDISDFDESEYATEYETAEKLLIENPECKWIKSLQTFDTWGDWKGIWNMLKLHTFSRLVELKICKYGPFRERKKLLHDSDDESEEFDEFYFVPYFKNAPTLKKLTLKDWTISIKLLEALHASCPLIEYLELDKITLKMDDDRPSQPIAPAKSVSSLKLGSITTTDIEYLYLEYVIHKYPNLRYLYFPHGFKNITDDSSSSSDEWFTRSPVTDEEKENRQKSEGAREKSYRENTTNFISRLPKTITTLETDTSDHDIIEAISTSATNIVSLNVSNLCCNILEAAQLKPLVYMETLRSLKIEMKSPGGSQLNGIPLTHITRLFIDHPDDNYLLIDWLLLIFPSLEHLDLTSKGIMAGNFESIAGEMYPKLKTLHIQHTYVAPNVYEFLKRATPNLEVLNVSGIIGSKSKRDGYHVDLTGWNLERCKLYFGNAFGHPDRIECKVTIQGISRTFIFYSPENSLIISPGDSDYYRAKITSAFSVTCDDIKHIRINSYRIRRLEDTLYCG